MDNYFLKRGSCTRMTKFENDIKDIQIGKVYAFTNDYNKEDIECIRENYQGVVIEECIDIHGVIFYKFRLNYNYNYFKFFKDDEDFLQSLGISGGI